MPIVAFWIMWVIDKVGFLVGLFAFVHALTQRSDAFTAADRKTKPIWLGLTGGSAAVMFLFDFYEAGLIFWVAGIVAALVYIVDVRPKLIEVQKGGRN